MEMATSMIAFSTSLGVMFAIIYYLYQMINLNFIEAFLYAIIYINVNLLVLLYITRRLNVRS